MRKLLAMLVIGLLSQSVIAEESVMPPSSTNSIDMNIKVSKHIVKYTHYKFLGFCFWLEFKPLPKMKTTLAVEHFTPDLAVAVYNRPTSNPWKEASYFYENKVALAGYNQAYKLQTGNDLGFGEMSHQRPKMHINETRARIVDVIGSPTLFSNMGLGVLISPVTNAYAPYYLSQMDAFLDRSEAAEVANILLKPWLLFNHNISTIGEDWGPEFPRLMTVSHPSRFKSSLVAAMHAADIATNGGGVHVTPSGIVPNSCGKKCTVAPVIFDKEQKSILWQEVYPKDRLLTPGKSQSYETEDDKKGNGNYVYVIWRKYKGCIQHSGRFLGSTASITETSRR